MARTFDRQTLRRAALGAFIGLAASGCSGVSPDVVRNGTAAITAQVALAKASLVSCRGGDRTQCDSAQKNLEAISAQNNQLSVAADQ
jgi:hypothetical protein